MWEVLRLLQLLKMEGIKLSFEGQELLLIEKEHIPKGHFS
jgi:hypothetical protein